MTRFFGIVALSAICQLALSVSALALEDEFTLYSKGLNALETPEVYARDDEYEQCALIIDEDGNSSTSYFTTTTVNIKEEVQKSTSSTKASTTAAASSKSSTSTTTSKTSTTTTKSATPVLTENAAVYIQPSSEYLKDFVVKGGNKLWLDGKEFRFQSFNVPGLLLIEDRENGWVVPHEREQIDAVRTVAQLNGRVIRTYTLAVGSSYHIQGIGKYNEAAFVAMDKAIANASKFGIRLIIPLINNYFTSGDVTSYGIYKNFADLYGESASAFYTSSKVINGWKDVITYVLDRVNTVSGIRYGDDPAILAWQLGNELGGWNSYPPTSWITTITAHIRSKSKSLVMDGGMGGLISDQKWTKDLLSNSNSPDIFDNHYYYGTSDIARITSDLKLLTPYSKVFVIGEFGLSSTSVYEKIYQAVQNNRDVAGTLIWSLRLNSIQGGLYVHSEGKNSAGKTFWSYHAPGFPSTSTYNPNSAEDEREVITLIRKYAALIAETVAINPIPPAPYLNPNRTSRGKLVWMGASYASSYTVERKDTGASDSSYQSIGTNIVINTKFAQFAFYDTNLSSSKKYDYRVWAIGPGGKSPEASEVKNI